MTRDDIHKEIEALTVEIRTLSYSSTKEAAEKILHYNGGVGNSVPR